MTVPIRFAIHGFGRIGRRLARVAHGDPHLELVAVNDPAGVGRLAPLLVRDSIHGRFAADVRAQGDDLRIDGQTVRGYGHEVPAHIPWQDAGVRVVVDCSGTAAAAEPRDHLRAGEDCGDRDGPVRVLVSAIARSADVTLCRGVNDDAFDPRLHRVVSAASCTTNCLALLVQVLHERFGIERALMSEVHSYTGNQRLVDGAHDDPRRARAAAVNIVPTSTAAPAAVEELLPALAGRLAGQAVRVPTPDMALLDLVATLERDADADTLRAAFEEAAAGSLRGLLATCDEPLVSSDLVGDPHSAVVDLPLIQSLGPSPGGAGALVRVAAWYDNETGYCHRLAELIRLLGDAP